MENILYIIQLLYNRHNPQHSCLAWYERNESRDEGGV